MSAKKWLSVIKNQMEMLNENILKKKPTCSTADLTQARKESVSMKIEFIDQVNKNKNKDRQKSGKNRTQHSRTVGQYQTV